MLIHTKRRCTMHLRSFQRAIQYYTCLQKIFLFWKVEHGLQIEQRSLDLLIVVWMW